MLTKTEYSKIKTYLINKQSAQNEQYETMRLADLNKTIKILQQFFRKKDCKVFIFGSMIHKGAFMPYSDVDIALSDYHGNRIDLFCKLSNLFQRKIDLVILEKSSIKEYILNDCIQIK